jgi:hypothetical protein
VAGYREPIMRAAYVCILIHLKSQNYHVRREFTKEKLKLKQPGISRKSRNGV